MVGASLNPRIPGDRYLDKQTLKKIVSKKTRPLYPTAKTLDVSNNAKLKVKLAIDDSLNKI